MENTKFKIGEKVIRGGDIPGEVRAIFTSKKGRLNYVVEYLSGVQRICRENQLEKAPYGYHEERN